MFFNLITKFINNYKVINFLLISINLFVFTEAKADDLTSSKCRIDGYQYELECGILDVPLRYSQTSNQKIKISWKRVKSLAKYPFNDPVIWIGNISASSSTKRAPAVIKSLGRLLNQRDLIWIDFRGSGDSENLNCRETEAIETISNRIQRPSIRLIEKCDEKILKKGGYETFNATQIANDFELLRQHLKLSKINVFAEGYGITIANEWIKNKPNLIKTLVSDSPYFNFQNDSTGTFEVLNKLISHCEAQASCKKQYPDTEVNLLKIIKRLPVTTTQVNPITRKSENLIIKEETLYFLLRGVLSNPEKSIGLVLAINEAYLGNWTPFIGLNATTWSRHDNAYDYGLWVAFSCNLASNDTRFQDKSEIKNWLLKMGKLHHQNICTNKNLIEKKPYKLIGVPSMIFQGELDINVTNIDKTDNVTKIYIPAAGGNILSYGCAKDLIYKFIDRGVEIEFSNDDLSCLNQVSLPAPLVNN